MTEMYLGTVWLSNAKIARLLPVATYAGGKWTSIRESVTSFPPEGKVLAVKSELIHVSEHSVWSFRTRENPVADKDRLLAEDLVRATPIVDLSSLTLEQARRALYETGIELPRGSDGHVVVLLEEGLMAEQRVSFDRPSGRWRGTPPNSPVVLARAPRLVLEAPQVQGQRFLPNRTTLKWEALKKVDWSSDADFVEHTFNRFRRISRNLGDTSHGLPAKSAVQYVARTLRDSGLLSGDEEIVQNLDRLKAQWPRIERALGAAEGLIEAVLETGAARAAIASAIQDGVDIAAGAMRTEVEQMVRREAEVELAELTRKRDELLEEIAFREREARQLEAARLKAQKSCREATDALDGLHESIDAEVARLRQVFEESSATELVYARDIAARLETASKIDGAGRDPVLFPTALPPWSAGEEARSVEAVLPQKLGDRLRLESDAAGIEAADLGLLDGFVRAGEFVVLVGRARERAVMAYARSVSAGRIRAMTLDATVVGLDDLWRIPGTQLPTALAFAWTAASAAPRQTFLVCLRGLEGAAVRTWLPALVNVLRSGMRPRNLFLLATADVRATTEGGTAANLEGWLSSSAVGLCPRDSNHAGLTLLHAMAHEAATPATALRQEDKADRIREFPPKLLALASDNDRDPSTLVRLVSVLEVLRETATDHELEPHAAAWASTVDTGRIAPLPVALQKGYESLTALQAAR